MKKSFLLSALGFAATYALYSFYKKMNEFNLANKTVLITGGSHGLGFVLAKLCLEEKCNVVICSRTGHELEAARKQLETNGAKITAITCDVTKRDEVRLMVQKVREIYGTIDVLINNAGIIQVGPFENMTEKDFKDAMNIHFWAPLYTTLEVWKDMKIKSNGRIVNISSIGGKVTVPHLLPYTVSKFALTGFSNGLRTELKKYGIHVTTVNPGLIRTGSARHIITKGRYEKEFANFSTLSVLPVVTISAEYAGRRIINAVKNGESEITISLPAKIIAFLQFFFPGTVTNLFAIINRFLPGPTTSDEPKSGFESVSGYTPVFTRRGYENNELLYNQPTSK